MKTTVTAIDKIYSLLKTPITGLSIPVYIQNKPTAINPAEYVVLNALPINAELMQKCTVNVNYHVKDLGEGVPDVEMLDITSASIIALLDGTVQIGTTNDFLVDYESQETIRLNAPINEHYSNLRFTVRIINK